MGVYSKRTTTRDKDALIANTFYKCNMLYSLGSTWAMRRKRLCLVSIVIASMELCGRWILAEEPVLQVAPFRAEVTPSVGEGPCVGCMPRVREVEHPLELRGLVLRTRSETYVIAGIDYCGVCNTSDETLRDALGRAAGAPRSQVALQSLHQHTAPILDADAVRILHGEKSKAYADHLRFTEQIADRAGRALKASLQNLRPITRVVATRAKVEQVASNRRVRQSDASVAVRASLTREAAVRDAPEGLIDPWLRTVTLLHGQENVVHLHYYATHPQTFYGDERISWDCVGMARDRFERQTGVFTIYFTGCAGNITVGKYNDGARATREVFAGRIFDAMLRSRAAKAEVSVDLATLGAGAVTWMSAPVAFTVRNDGPFDPNQLRQQLAPDRPFASRLTAAMYAGFGQRLRDGRRPEASRLRIGPIDIVHLPGEPFVEFQLFAQRQAKSAFVCVAGYGECGVWYYGPDSIYSDRGGYEQTFSVTGPCQKNVESLLKGLLAR